MRIIVLLAAALALAGCTQQSPTPEPAASTETQAPPVPAFHETEREAQPLPSILPASAVGDPRAAKVYEIAARIPGVLAQVPCYCYCDRGHGHKGLLDCHKDAHSAT